jgi:extradiol dioxygenase family protein
VITQVSFIAYPASNIPASRRFYDVVLGSQSTSISDDWIEYAIGDTTFAITQADADHPVPISPDKQTILERKKHYGESSN